MTPSEKATMTRQERTKREKAERRALLNDVRRGREVLREIRDDDNAMPFDRIEAVRLLHELSETCSYSSM